MRKKIVAGFLALTLVAGSMMPMSVSAEEIENTETAAEPVENEEKDFETQMPEMEEPETVQANGASIVESGSCGDNATYTLDSNGELRISGSGKIKGRAFNGKKNIRTVVISSGITGIGDYAFGSCSSLNSISIPSSVTSIGYAAFSSCNLLRKVVLPYKINSVEEAAFLYCSSLEILVFPKNKVETSISSELEMICQCTNLKQIYGYDATTIVVREIRDYSLKEWVEKYGKKYVSLDNGIQLTLNANGGSISSSTKKVYPAYTYGTLPTPIRTGYDFAGWYTSASSGQKINSSDIVQSVTNQTLYAHWKQIKYTVTFNPNGGSVETGSRVVGSGETLGTFPTPTRNGYTFEGWYTQANGGSKIEESMKVTGNVTLYAHWKQIKYTVTFHPNGGSVQTKSRVVGSGETLSTFPTPTRSGYTFEGWYTQASGGSKVEESMKVTGNVTLYAHWKQIKYTVTFHPNGGSVQTKSKVVGGGETLSTFPTPTRSGYTFEGWYTQASGGNKVSGSLKVTKNMTLYAHWKQNNQTPSKYTVTFNPNGGSVQTKSRVVGSGETFSTFPTPTRSGYTFEGWYTQASGGSKVSGSLKVTKNMTLYAHWKQNSRTPLKYTITFHPNGGSVQNGTQTVTSGGSLKSYPTPTRKGYAFDGWYTSASGGKKVTGSIKVTGNRTFYAH